MAAGENQAQTVVVDFTRIFQGIVIGFLRGFDRQTLLFYFLSEIGLAAKAVNGFMPGGLDDPRAGQFRHAGFSPVCHGGGKCLLREFFCQVEVTDQADQGSHDAPPVGAIDFFDCGSGIRTNIGCDRQRHDPL